MSAMATRWQDAARRQTVRGAEVEGAGNEGRSLSAFLVSVRHFCLPKMRVGKRAPALVPIRTRRAVAWFRSGKNSAYRNLLNLIHRRAADQEPDLRPAALSDKRHVLVGSPGASKCHPSIRLVWSSGQSNCLGGDWRNSPSRFSRWLRLRRCRQPFDSSSCPSLHRHSPLLWDQLGRSL